jgi:hypothetical protein
VIIGDVLCDNCEATPITAAKKAVLPNQVPKIKNTFIRAGGHDKLAE